MESLFLNVVQLTAALPGIKVSLCLGGAGTIQDCFKKTGLIGSSLSTDDATGGDQEMEMDEEDSGENCVFHWERVVVAELRDGCESLKDFTATDDDMQAVSDMRDETNVAKVWATLVTQDDELLAVHACRDT